MRVKVSELSGVALDWAAAKSIGLEVYEDDAAGVWRCDTSRSCGFLAIGFAGGYSPSTNWAQGGLLIERFRVSIIYSDEICNPCAWTDDTAAWHADTPLIAACRAIVSAKLGDEIDLPEGLV